MAAVVPNLAPPANDLPINPATGTHSQSWTEYNQSVADRLAALPTITMTGTTKGDDAAAGMIGEYMTATGSVGLTTNVYADIATLALTAGDWDVTGNLIFAIGGTRLSVAVAGISTTSATIGSVYEQTQIAGGVVGGTVALGTGCPMRFSLSAGATAHLVGVAAFTGSGLTAAGFIRARRVR